MQINVKVLHAIRVASDKHPPLAFDFMEGTVIKGGESYGTSSGASAGVDIEYGKAFEGGKFSASAPSLEEARKKAQEAKLIPADEVTPTWRVVEVGTVQFATGQSEVAGTRSRTWSSLPSASRPGPETTPAARSGSTSSARQARAGAPRRRARSRRI